MTERKLYISDLHLGHTNVTKAGKDFDGRGFKDLDEMHEFITKKWNANVKSGDHIYIIGDACFHMDNRNFDYFKELMLNLNGNKHLIYGNHDKLLGKKMSILYVEVVPYKEVQDVVFSENKRVILSHYYMPFYNHHFKGSILLHGHSHNSAESEMERRITAMLNRQGYPCEIYNVGCMYPYIDYAPRTLEYIVSHYDKNADYTRGGKRDDDFEECVQALCDYHGRNPDMRFGQTISKVLGGDPYAVSDKQAIERFCAGAVSHSEIKLNR